MPRAPAKRPIPNCGREPPRHTETIEPKVGRGLPTGVLLTVNEMLASPSNVRPSVSHTSNCISAKTRLLCEVVSNAAEGNELPELLLLLHQAMGKQTMAIRRGLREAVTRV